MEEDIEVYVGSGNVFADLGLPNPEELQLKAHLAIEIRRVMEDKRLTRKQAAERMGLDREQMSHLLKGPSADFSIDQLVQYLNRLGQQVELSVSVRERPPDEAPLTAAA